MKEKIKKIGQIIIRGVFLISLFLIVVYFVKIITPSYCIVSGGSGRLSLISEHCNWQYILTSEERLGFTIVLFILTLFIIYFVKKRYERKN